MMQHILLSGATALFGLGFTGLAVPQETPEGGSEASEASRYHVEVIIFANADFDPTEELFDYVAQRLHIEAPLALAAPTMRPVPEAVWTYPEDAEPETEPVPGVVRFGGRVIAAGRPLPEPRQAPSDRPRLVLDGVRRPPRELDALPRLALGPDGLASPVSETEAPALPEIRVMVEKTFAIPSLLELPEPPAEPPVDPFAVGPLVLGPFDPDALADADALDDAPVAPEEPEAEPPRRYAEELDREYAILPVDSSTERTIRYRVLRTGELRLGSAYARLQRLGGYRPLLHAGWSQEGLGEADSVPLPLSRLGKSNPAGTIQLHLQRFLHLTLDLDYRHTLSPGPASSPATAAPSVASSESPGRAVVARSDELSEIELAPHYYIVEDRRTRNGDVNYFDHPAFGVLVLVTRAPEAPEATDEDTQDGRPAA